MLSIHLRLGLPSCLFPSGFLIYYLLISIQKPEQIVKRNIK
jgi:hypothetical protein